MRGRLGAMALTIGLAAGLAACSETGPGASRVPPPVVQSGPAPEVGPLPMTLPATNQAPAASEQPAVPMKLSFDLLGRHKDYSQVTASVARNPQGQEQTLINAVDGENFLSLVVDGTGPGEHPISRVEIKDAMIGKDKRVFDTSQPNMTGKVTFTTFDPAAGRIEGTFSAGYTGAFFPVQVQNGTLAAALQGTATPVAAGNSGGALMPFLSPDEP